ncbi:MAG: hypothetical protein IKE65_10185, partial [Clostridia bacterium]|nr:hypothetical protein [Clostridia bacterium]
MSHVFFMRGFGRAFFINVFRLFRRAEQTTTRYAGVQQMLYIVNALRVECEEWRVELMAGH